MSEKRLRVERKKLAVTRYLKISKRRFDALVNGWRKSSGGPLRKSGITRMRERGHRHLSLNDTGSPWFFTAFIYGTAIGYLKLFCFFIGGIN